MEKPTIITAGEDPSQYSIDEVGGKGLYLLKLHQIAQNTGRFHVPNFFIIPTNAEKSYSTKNSETRVIYESDEVRSAFDQLTKPVAVRSSSPLEDGVNASFAGMFDSFLDQHDYEEATRVANSVYRSPSEERVKRYAERMGIQMSYEMALIFQEQVTDFWEGGVIQLEEDKAITEYLDRKGRTSQDETDYRFLDEACSNLKPHLKPHDFLSEGEYYYPIQCAREAKKLLGLEGTVQVECFLKPGTLPSFVQIRQLPKVNSHSAQFDMDIPEGVAYMESEVCNDVVGDLTLPAYVTTSQQGIKRILIETGQSFYLNSGSTDKTDSMNERIERFYEKSKLANNRDFKQFRDIVPHEKVMGIRAMLPYYNEAWTQGNSLFDDYVLVCDKLDESIVDMADVTTNKRAIITCMEATKTSHAMTVARDLGIMCMGVEGDLYDFNPEFFHQVETGDTIRMKSDGKRAVAYIEKKRESDPYEKLIEAQ